MNKIILFRLVMIFVLIITICACNSSTDANLKSGTNLQSPDAGGMVWNVKFKSRSNGLARQQCMYLIGKAIADSVMASNGYSGQSFTISQSFKPTGDTLVWQIKLIMTSLPANFSYSIPQTFSAAGDTIPIGEPGGPPPGFTHLFVDCVQQGELPCQ